MSDVKVRDSSTVKAALTLPECIGIVRKILSQWWVVLLIALSAAMLADVVVEKNYKPQYQTRSIFVVTTKGIGSNMISNLLSASETAQQFSQILSSHVLKQKVAKEAGLTAFDAEMEAVVVPETNLMTLTVTADSAANAFNIITAVMNNYNRVSDYIIDDVILDILQPPTIPQQPSGQPGSRRTVQMAFWGSMLVMVCLLGAYAYVKDTVKSEDDVSEKVDARLVGTIFHEGKAKSLKRKLRGKKVSMTIQNPMLGFKYLEANKMMASRIRNRLDSQKLKTLVVTSVAENEGKSTVAANLALALAKEKKKVLLIDCDFRKPAQHKIFEIDIQKLVKLNDVLEGKADAAHLIQNIDGTGVFGIFNEAPNMHMFEHGEQKLLAAIISQLKRQLDYIIIDTSPIGLVSETEEVCMVADAALLVVKHDFVLIRDINDAVDALNRSCGRVLGCVLNDLPEYYGLSSAYGYGSGYGGHYGKRIQ